MNRLSAKLATTVAVLLLAGGCAESPTQSLSVDSARFDLVGGNGQQGRVGEELPLPLVVRVTAGGAPVANALVNFVVTAGGGSVYAGKALTNAQGLAQDYWTLGAVAGSTQEVQVRAVDSNTGAAIVYGSFTATALGPVATVAVVPDSAEVEIGQTVQLVATPRDITGRVIPNNQVSWASSNPGIAMVDANGLIHGVSVGTATIRALSEGRFYKIKVKVTSPTKEIVSGS